MFPPPLPLGMPLLPRDMDETEGDPSDWLLHPGWKEDLRPTGHDGHTPQGAGSLCMPQMRALIHLIITNWGGNGHH